MSPQNVERQPHEFKPAKVEAVLASIKNMATEKTDLIVQHLRQPMQPGDRDVKTFFLRFWRLAEGQVSLQEIPMTPDELAALGVGILKYARAQEKRAETPEPMTFEWKEGSGKWRSGAEQSQAETTSPLTRVLVRPEPDGRYRAVVRYNQHRGDTGACASAAEAITEAAKIVAAFEKTEKEAAPTPTAEPENPPASSATEEKEPNPNV